MSQSRQLAAIMFTDIVGYTALMGKDEQRAIRLLDKNLSIQKPLIEQHQGKLLKEIGDGLLCSFNSAIQAVKCAIEIQDKLKDDSELNIKVGIHIGDVLFRDGDVFGDGVNISSRIESLASSGEILVSEGVYNCVKNQAGIRAEFVKEETLKNVEKPVEIYKVQVEGIEIPETAPQQLIREPTRPPDKASIVVLPFLNVSSDPENEYFADGLTEEITADLSGIEAIRVISRTTAMRFKGADKDLRTIGNELNVRYVLEGSVRKVEDKLRITAQLIDAGEDVHVWSEKYNGTLEDVFEIQERVSTAIAQALKVELSPTEEGQLAHRPVEDARAYSLYLQARGEYGQQTQESLERAMRHLDSALSIVGESALLYTSLGQIHFLYGSLMLGARVHHQHLEQAEEFARKALELEADSPAADGLLGFILYDRFETEEGLRRMKRAVNLNPDDVGNLNSAVLTFSMCAKDEEAAEWLEHLLEADPLNAWTRFIAGEHHLFAGRFDQAQAHFRRGYELEPLGPITRTSYAQVLAYSGQVDQALEILNLSKDSISPDMVWDMIGQALRYALMEDGARARQFLTEDLRSDARTDMLYSWLLAECYALLGESDEAVDWLRNAVEGGFLNPRFFSQVDPFFEPLRGMSEFQDLMNHLQKRWAALRV